MALILGGGGKEDASKKRATFYGTLVSFYNPAKLDHPLLFPPADFFFRRVMIKLSIYVSSHQNDGVVEFQSHQFLKCFFFFCWRQPNSPVRYDHGQAYFVSELQSDASRLKSAKSNVTPPIPPRPSLRTWPLQEKKKSRL